MAESSGFMRQSREILKTPTHDGLENVLNRLTLPQETTEFKTAFALYNFCAAKFPNCLTLKLLNLYRSSSSAIVRSQSIHLLSETLAEFRNRRIELNLIGLDEIKPVLISCLTMRGTKESDMKFLGRIVSLVAYDVLMLDNGGWDELSDCILELAISEPLKAFHVFIDLPPVYGRFIYRFMQSLLEKAKIVLLNPEEDRVGDWCLALKTVVKMGIQLMDSELRFDLVKVLLSVLVRSASELVEKGMEQFLLRALQDLARFLSRDMSFCNYNKEQRDFVSAFMFKIRELGTRTKEAAKIIHRMIKSSNNQPQQRRPVSEREWFDCLKTLSPLQILRILASNILEERSRFLAIRRLNVMLDDHTSRKEEIDVPVIRELQPLIISCLWREGISESDFRVFGGVVYHVAYEMMNFEFEVWYELRDYIVSKSKTEFERAVYIFQCLIMWLEKEHFVIPVMKSLLPEISRRLNPPRELLVDNSCWVLTFVGAFCAAIHVVDIRSYAESVNVIADKMVDSVNELVERGMEVGIVRRAFRDVESIVKKQNEWFGMSEYRFVKGLLRRLCVIEGMKMESRMVLWRTNVYVERGMSKLEKELSEIEAS
ncbi:hypothetical protein EUTSA_v10027691mg [Eutrema salsugineum]|uniref:DUF577 domain-containing protein n=1 Tax=Eutrema salsugineum TaxID=72664 RepID=V4NLP7_EUTSA|nr:uncharacterized protein LOC18022738 [Eutrema salsugineum]ESQ47346.1 hypothetical protein EUTSA_v10027691mg [Eutrema salsugineum]